MSGELKVCVATSRKWKGEEIAREITEKIKRETPEPKFILLFSTIHHKEEFKPMLEGIKKEFPDAPLVGGTVAGFMNQDGVFTRGVTAMAVQDPEMQVAVGVGKNVKRNPRKAARQAAKMIKRKGNKITHRNKLLFAFVSGAIIPRVPFVGTVNNVNSVVLGKILSRIGMRISALLGTGVGKEETFIIELSKYFENYYIFGGSSVDDYSCLDNYVFLNETPLRNSAVLLLFGINKNVYMNWTLGAKPTDKKFTITETAYDDRIVVSINGKSAKRQFLEEISKISEERFKVIEPAFYYKTSDYFPIGFEDNPTYTTGVGAIYGEELLLGYRALGRKGVLLSVSGKEILESVDELLKEFENEKAFAFVYSSGIRLNMLSHKSWMLREKYEKYFDGLPYLAVYPMNNYFKKPGERVILGVYSANVISVEK